MEGQGQHIWKRLQTAAWRDLTAGLDVIFRTFGEMGLDPASPDDVVWRFCQGHDFYLLTSNRNAESESSLEATIRCEGTPRPACPFSLFRSRSACTSSRPFWKRSWKSCWNSSSTQTISAARGVYTFPSP